jgi:hypothetical protein
MEALECESHRTIRVFHPIRASFRPWEVISRSTFWVKLRNWEYWPFGVVYAGVFLLHLWQSLKARSFFYFSAANPGLENSGFIGERKSEIMRKIPSGLQPDWFLSENQDEAEFLDAFHSSGLSFPVICKPDVGERGQGVKKVHSLVEILEYHRRSPAPFLVQGFVDLPMELGIFYVRLPGAEKGRITSVVEKQFLSIRGDGEKTLSELVQDFPRARFVAPFLKSKFSEQWETILPGGTVLELEGIGNHCRGTTFLDSQHRISPELENQMDRISQQIGGFFFGRFDLRAASQEDLEAGRLQILELNGAGAEPAHIYQPGFSFWKGQKVLWQHWQWLFAISREQHRNGVPYWNLAQARTIRKIHKNRLDHVYA